MCIRDSLLKTSLDTSPTSSSPLFSTTPHARRGRRIRDGLTPIAADPGKKSCCTTLLDPKPKVALSNLLEIQKCANNCPLRVEKDTRNRLLGHPKSPSRRVSTLLGARLRLLAPPSAGVRAGCSQLRTPGGGPGGAGSSFSQSAQSLSLIHI